MTDEASDPLSQLAPLLRVRPEIQEVCRFGEVWASPHEAIHLAQFHIVTRGSCVLELQGRSALSLATGDILLLPHGQAHVVRSPRFVAGAAQPIASRQLAELTVKSTADHMVETELVCGVLRFESGDFPLDVLPDVIVRRGDGAREAVMQAALIDAMRGELADLRPGSVAIAADLASALLVMLLRAHLEAEPPARGLLALLGHRGSARAVAAMLGDPSRDWTLDSLAHEAMMSRASLVRLFQRRAGVAPMAFLIDLRLGLARRRLVDGVEPIARIAGDLGYQSEATFSRAILRRFGVRPGALRSGAHQLQAQEMT